MLWLQGWDRAPEVVGACYRTWRKLNPSWDVRALTLSDVSDVLADDPLVSLAISKNLPRETVSDFVRIALLRKSGGVWADSTCYCLKPLDSWLPEMLCSGFFAFANPGPDRMLSNWFLAAEKNNYIVARMYDLIGEYWSARSIGDDYFWFHFQFADAYRKDGRFRDVWDRTPKLPAKGPHRYVPYGEMLKRPASFDDRTLLNKAPVPLIKLTHKLEASAYSESSVLNYLVQRSRLGPTERIEFSLSMTESLRSRLRRSLHPGLGVRTRLRWAYSMLLRLMANLCSFLGR